MKPTTQIIVVANVTLIINSLNLYFLPYNDKLIRPNKEDREFISISLE